MFGGGTTYPEIIRYECEDGYILNGPTRRQCQSNGKWSGLDPTCEGNSSEIVYLTVFFLLIRASSLAKNCGILMAPMNGTIKGTDFTFPNVIEFACDNGFDLIGPHNRHCQANGSWSGENAICRGKLCGSFIYSMAEMNVSVS